MVGGGVVGLSVALELAKRGREVVVCEKETAIAVAERLRTAIEESLIPTTDHPDIEITVSLGVAQLDDSSVDYCQWLVNADKALYQAKQSGRNKCPLFECANNRQPQCSP